MLGGSDCRSVVLGDSDCRSVVLGGTDCRSVVLGGTAGRSVVLGGSAGTPPLISMICSRGSCANCHSNLQVKLIYLLQKYSNEYYLCT